MIAGLAPFELLALALLACGVLAVARGHFLFGLCFLGLCGLVIP